MHIFLLQMKTTHFIYSKVALEIPITALIYMKGNLSTVFVLSTSLKLQGLHSDSSSATLIFSL